MNYKSLALLFVLPMTNALANNCPDLSGAYLCKFQTIDSAAPDKIIKITQHEKNETTTYSIDGSERIADGILHSTPIAGLTNVQYTAVCDESVTFHLDANVLNNSGRVIGNMFSHLILYKMDDRLRFLELGSYDLETEYIPFNNEAVCQPVN